MTRIHEALRKAAMEQAVAGAMGPTPLRTSPQMVARTAIGSGQAPAPAIPTQAVGDVLSFADLRAHCAHPQWQPDPNLNLFLPELSAHAEQFRTLRSRLYQLRGTRPLRIVLVTSATPGEGKTFVASNLAQAVVRQNDRRALLIDADLRHPRLHLPLRAPAAPGLTDYLQGRADEMAVIQCPPRSNLCLIPGGNAVANPSELLSNGLLKRLLDRVAPAFDWIILDSPPCLPVADASVVAASCDGVLLVVRANVAPAEHVQRARQEFPDGKVVGVVLNGVDKPHGYSQYYRAAAETTKLGG